ncbi:unnamed protein product, partial [Prorocentrum cordatum]
CRDKKDKRAKADDALARNAEHWDQRPEKRGIQTVVGTIQAAAQKYGAITIAHILQDSSCQVPVQAERVEFRHNVLEAIRNEFVDLVLGEATDITEPQVGRALAEARPELLQPIFTVAVQEMADASVGAKGACTITAIGKVILDVAPEFGRCDLSEMNLDPSMTEYFEGLWSHQVAADLSVIVQGARVLENPANSFALSRELRPRCVTIGAHKDMLSSRHRAFFKTAHGARANRGKTAWDVMELVHKAAVKQRDLATSGPDAAAAFAIEVSEMLKTELAREWRAAANALMDKLLVDEGDEGADRLKVIGGYSGQCGRVPSDQVNKDDADERVANFKNFAWTLILASFDTCVDSSYKQCTELSDVYWSIYEAAPRCVRNVEENKGTFAAWSKHRQRERNIQDAGNIPDRDDGKQMNALVQKIG